ncbi:homeobox domain protein [Ceratobasidium sp. AG-Ba]|nr:homeobox domain protein [Ceratobasidium sp. AG-Ba]QRW11964.1 homeobox domain protein [Ceratobasidium sp. AG-Ba]
MELANPARRSSRRQIDYRNITRPDGEDAPAGEDVSGHGNNAASSERVHDPEEMIDTPPDSQSNKPRVVNAGRTNKSRTVFTPEQLALLQDAFEKNPYPSREVREKLEEVTGLGRKRLSDWFGHRRHALKLKRLGSTPSLPTARVSPPMYPHSRSTSPASETRSLSPRRRAHSSASPSHTSPYSTLPHSYHNHPEPRASGLSSLASWSSASAARDERPHHSYYAEDQPSSAPTSHPGVPFPTVSKQSYSLDSYASRRNVSPQPSSSASSTHGLQQVRSRPSLEWACAIERQRVRPYPKKPSQREAGWSRHLSSGAPGSRSRSHSHSAVGGHLNGHKEEDIGASDTEPEDEDVHEVLTPPQSLMALERQARVQSFASAMSSSSGYKYDSDTQADLDAAMILVGMGMS